jgi:hypothetical protein
LGLLDGVSVEQVVDGLIGGDEGQAISQFEALLTQSAAPAEARHAQGRLVDQLQG